MATFNYESAINIFNRDSGKIKFATPENLFIPKINEEYMVRILPGGEGITSNSELFFEVTARHKLIGVNTRKSIGCLKIMKDERCPICNFVSSLYNLAKNNPNESDLYVTLAKSIKRYTRFIFNVLVRGQEARGVLVWSVGKKLRENIFAGIQRLYSKKQDWDITHPETGRDYNVIVQSVGGYPDYSKSSFDFSTSPLAKSREEINAIMSKRFDLRQYQPKAYSQEETEMILAEFLQDIGRDDLIKIISLRHQNQRTFVNIKSLSEDAQKAQQQKAINNIISKVNSGDIEDDEIDEIAEDINVNIINEDVKNKKKEDDLGERLTSLINSLV